MLFFSFLYTIPYVRHANIILHLVEGTGKEGWGGWGEAEQCPWQNLTKYETSPVLRALHAYVLLMPYWLGQCPTLTYQTPVLMHTCTFN